MEVYEKMKKVKKQRFYCLVVSTFFSLVYRIIIMIMITNDELYLRNQPVLSKIGIISRAIYLFTFTYIAALWIDLTR
jgi:hypothetical protein